MKHKFYCNVIKRCLDFFCALLGVIILSPVLLIVFVLNKIILKGNAIFKQYRVGKNGKIFAVYKFRTMTNKTDENGNLLPDKDRMTKWGKFIRKLSLDELPQFFNILKGNMSFIGPRPRMVEECIFLDASQQDRFKAVPGITGWAQVNGRNNITFDKVVQYDKEYVEKASLWFDIKIIFKTIGCVLGKKDIEKKGTVSNEFHGDYLLRTGQVSESFYNERILDAKNLIGQAKESKKAVVYTPVIQNILDEKPEIDEEKDLTQSEIKDEI